MPPFATGFLSRTPDFAGTFGPSRVDFVIEVFMPPRYATETRASSGAGKTSLSRPYLFTNV